LDVLGFRQPLESFHILHRVNAPKKSTGENFGGTTQHNKKGGPYENKENPSVNSKGLAYALTVASLYASVLISSFTPIKQLS